MIDMEDFLNIPISKLNKIFIKNEKMKSFYNDIHKEHYDPTQTRFYENAKPMGTKILNSNVTYESYSKEIVKSPSNFRIISDIEKALNEYESLHNYKLSRYDLSLSDYNLINEANHILLEKWENEMSRYVSKIKIITNSIMIIATILSICITPFVKTSNIFLISMIISILLMIIITGIIKFNMDENFITRVFLPDPEFIHIAGMKLPNSKKFKRECL